MRYFYYAFARFQDILDARKLLEEVRFPELHGKTCRALPYDKELLQRVLLTDKELLQRVLLNVL